MSEFGPSVGVDYNDSGNAGQWSSAPSLYFDINDTHEGKTIVLKASGNPFGSDLVQTAAIKIRKTSAIIVYPTSITVSKGHPGKFGVWLTTAPKKDTTVTVSVTSSNPSEGTVNKSFLTLSKAAKIVKVKWRNNGSGSTDTYTIVIGKAVSDDLRYDGMKPSDVKVNSGWRIEVNVTSLNATATGVGGLAASEASISDDSGSCTVGAGPPIRTESSGVNYSVTDTYLLKKTSLSPDTEYIVNTGVLADGGIDGSASAFLSFELNVYSGSTLKLTHSGSLTISGGAQSSRDYVIGCTVHNDVLSTHIYADT